MKYRITLLNHLVVLDTFFITVVLILFLSYFFKLNASGVIYAFCVYAIFAIPAFYIHTLHYLENRNQEIEVNATEVILFYKGKEVLKYSKHDLLKIILYKPATLDKGSLGFQVTPYESYNYARIIPINGKEIVFTCLLLPDVEKAVKILREVPFERKRGLFFNIERPPVVVG